jgi:hypothetical protein
MLRSNGMVCVGKAMSVDNVLERADDRRDLGKGDE